MLSYCLTCSKKEIKSSKFTNKNKEKQMLLSKCVVCDKKTSRFIKKQKASGLLSSLGIISPLSKIPLLGDVLFWKYKMKNKVNIFLLAGDKFMHGMHLR